MRIALCKENGVFEARRHRQDSYWMHETIEEALRNHFYHNEHIMQLMESKQMQVMNNEMTAFRAAQDLLDLYFHKI